MKKKSFNLLVLGLLVIGFLCSVKTVSNNFVELEALADDTPEAFSANCREQENDCLAQCEKCGNNVYAPGHRGPSYNAHGWCSECIQKWLKQKEEEGGEDNK